MQEKKTTRNRPTLLDLRGHFHLESEPYTSASSVSSHRPINIFPITDEQAIIARLQGTTLIDLPSQEILWSITCPALEAALDQEGDLLALGARGWVYLWDLRSGSLTHTFALGDDIPTALAFHPQGLFLAVAPYAGDIQLWRLSDGQMVQSLSSEEYAAYNDCASYKSVAFSPDGQFLADGNFEAGAVWLWRIPSGQFVQQLLPSVEGRVHGLAFSPDGQILVGSNSGGLRNQTGMRVWDMQTLRTLQGFAQNNWFPTFCPDGKLLASVGLADGWFQITIWDVATRKEIRRFPAHQGRLYYLTFSPSGKFLLSLGDRSTTIRVWEVESGREIYRIS